LSFSRRGLIAVEAAASLALLAAAILERRQQGVQLELLLVALGAAALHLRRLLAIRAGAPGPRPAAFVLEAVALAGAFTPVRPPSWALSVACLASLAGARADEGERAPLWLRALGLLALAGGAFALHYRIYHPPGFALLWQHKSVIHGVALAPILLEALLGRGTRESSFARIAAGAVLVVAASRAEASGDLILLGWVALRAVVELATRGAPAADLERRRRRLALRLGFSIGVLVLVWLLGEAAFRVAPNRYREIVSPPLDTFHKPGAVTVYEGAQLGPKQHRAVVTRWNEHGWHDADHATAKPSGTARVLVLGDSFVEGVQVEQDELYHRRLEGALAARGERVEAIALAMSGWGQVQELEVLEREGFSYDPDLVVVEFLPNNDVRNNDDELEQLARNESIDSSFARPVFLRALASGLYFSAFVMDHLDLTIRNARGRRDPIDADVYRAAPLTPPELWARAWHRTEELLASTAALCTARGAGFAVVIFPSSHELGPPPPGSDLDGRLPARRMLELCTRRSLPCLDLTPRFAALPVEERPLLYVVGDGHWAAKGHALAATETARFLDGETRLWKSALERSRRK
jgi:hypothetical protein